jgi:hypothetical protein
MVIDYLPTILNYQTVARSTVPDKKVPAIAQ